MQFNAKKIVCSPLLPLLIISTILSACESDEIVEPGATAGVVSLEILPEGLEADWTLVTPTGDLVEGRGSMSLKNMLPGSYAATWEDVPGYRTPSNSIGELAPEETLLLSAPYDQLQFGTVVIDTEPDALNGRWALFHEDGDVIESAGDSTLVDIPSGPWTLGWFAEDGYVTPAPGLVEFNLAPGATREFTGEWTSAVGGTGTIQVDPDPDALDAPWNLTGPNGFEQSGSGDTDPDLAGLAEGEYTITWGSVPDHVTPDPETKTLSADQTIIFAALYVLGTGTITIDCEPNSLLDGQGAPWTLTAADGTSQSGNGDASLEKPAGEYTVSFGPVAGWLRPESVNVSLAMDEIEYVPGIYTIDPDLAGPNTGTIRVRVDPDEATWSISGPDGFEQSGSYSGDREFTDVVVGDYEVTWVTPDGYLDPASNRVEFALLDGEVETVRQDFAPIPVEGPVVEGTTGTFTQGATISISGRRFSTKPTAAPVKWDDFEVGSSGAPLASVQPEWTPYWEPGALYSDVEAHSGQLSVFNDPLQNHFGTNYFETPPTDTMFVSYWWRTVGAGDSEDYGIVKFTRISSLPSAGGDGAYNGVGAHTVSSWNPGYGAGSYILFTSDTSSGPPSGSYGSQYNIGPSVNVWQRQDFAIALSEDGARNGRFYYRVVGDTRANEETNTDFADLVVDNRTNEGSYKLNSVLMGLMAANAEGSFDLYLDDIYIDTTFARVEIGDQPDYRACTHLEMQIPASWSESEIQIEVNAGNLPAGPAYLFVIDKNDNASPGRPIQISR